MTITIAALQAEHHESGFAISHPSPRLSWRFGSTDTKDWTQESYTVTVKRNGKDEDYDVTSAESVLVPWPSKPLSSREIVKVQVKVTGNDGSSTQSPELTLEVGLLDRTEWKADMISMYAPRHPEETKPPFRLRRTFDVPNPGRARLYATAYGIYEVEINGKRIGDQVLAPGWQSYAHHLNYQTYDITAHLQAGTNTIGAYVGEGWYAGRLGRPGARNLWGDRPGFMAQVEVEGQVVVATDAEWAHFQGPVVTSEIYDGEVWDSRLDDPTWSTPGNTFVGHNYKAEVLPSPSAELVSSDAPPVRRVKELKAIEIIKTPSGKTVLDFGQNLVGWLRVEVNLPRTNGGEVTLRHAEVMENGELGTRPLRTAKATDKIILGESTKGWEPRFSFHGFRYVEVTDLDAVELTDFTAIVIFSDLRRMGTFECSHAMINQLHSNVYWSMLGNFVSVPTDCPQRDERLGWTGDIQVFTPTANYLFDTIGFLSGWLKDVAAETKQYDGITPVTVPHIPTAHRPIPRPMAIWADCTALTPMDLYTSYGDRAVLERQFESMLLWLDKGVPRNANGLYDPAAVQYGDWLDPRAHPSYPAHGHTDTHLCANAYLVYTTGVVAQIAGLLGKSEESRFKEAYTRLRTEFQQEYVTPNGRLMSDTQTAIALALRFELLDGKQRDKAVERLEWLIKWEGFKISTGFAGTPIILDTLADNGLLHLAYRMLQERDNPSWLYPVGMGATTIWERWDSMLPNGSINPGQMTSFNHYALGAVAAFLHGTLGGLSPLCPGWKTALIKPRPGGTLTSAKTAFDSPYGPYSVEWQLKNEKLSVKVSVPPNGSAKVVLPGVEEDIGSGERKYEVEWKKDERWPPSLIQGPQGVVMSDRIVE